MFKGQEALAAIFLTSSAHIMVRPREFLTAGQTRPDKRYSSLHPERFSPYTGLFISLSGISELDCATTKTDAAERSISIGRESLQVFFVLGALAYFQVLPLGGSREEKRRSQ